MNSPEFELQQSDHRLSYHPHNKNSGKPHGQHKLFLSDLYALVRVFTTFPYSTIEEDKFEVVYAGAACGSHIRFLADMFPDVTWHLYDPSEFDQILNELPSVHIHNKMFNDDEANKWKNIGDTVPDKHLIFLSDIRSGAFDDSRIWEDMLAQERWMSKMQPAYSLLKFRLPYPKPGQPARCKYSDGRLVKVPHAPTNSTELRLEVWKEMIGQKKNYDITQIEEQMAYFNRRQRYMQNYGVQFKYALWDAAMRVNRELHPKVARTHYPSPYDINETGKLPPREATISIHSLPLLRALNHDKNDKSGAGQAATRSRTACAVGASESDQKINPYYVV